MTAATRRVRIPSSGPFVLPDNPGGDPPQIGEGTPGLIFRFNGSDDPQTWPNADPGVQPINWQSYDGSVDPDIRPDWPSGQQGPFYVDFEMLLVFSQLGTTTVSDLALLLGHQFAQPVVREWDSFTIGSAEPLSMLVTERFIYREANPALVYSEFQVNMAAAADSGDVILNNPLCYAKFQFFQGPVQPGF